MINLYSHNFKITPTPRDIKDIPHETIISQTIIDCYNRRYQGHMIVDENWKLVRPLRISPAPDSSMVYLLPPESENPPAYLLSVKTPDVFISFIQSPEVP